MYITGSTNLLATIQFVQAPEFTVEDVCVIQSLSSGIIKQFTSQASSYAVIFKWDFGDGTTINSPNRTVTHEYSSAGTYIVRHQACLLDAECCYTNDIPWCTKTITIEVGLYMTFGSFAYGAALL